MSKGSNRRPQNASKISANWDTIFNKMIVTRVWNYTGHDNHKNEDCYECSKCKHYITLATYDKPDGIKCQGCEK